MAEKRQLFETAEDVNLKLSQCVILKNDQPIYVKQYCGGTNAENFEIYYTELPMFKRSRDYDTVRVKDPSLDWRSMSSRLGYMNAARADQREALFVQRTPARKSFQGLHSSNTKVSPWSGDVSYGLEPGVSNLDYHIREDYFVEMMNGKYPTVKECIEHFKAFPKTLSRAFNKFFAIKRPSIGPFYLQYKQQDIAWSDDPTYKWKLGRNFEYLQETLEHNKIAV